MKIRRRQQDDYGTFGDFLDDRGARIGATCELPYHENQPDVSCIPPGTYRCVRRYSDKHKRELFEITGVPGRSDIELHAANWPSQLLGCVALGATVDLVEGKKGVTDSDKTLDAFMASQVGVTSFWLDVVNPPPVLA